ncbi:replication initiation regulator SeqA [Motilimonas eburnea]|uniref:replication initiation regulator SeqA n=1 Tax=Motilimonas eburnea TaxID=1737488 RepID=UPI001E2A2A34|nr:replication initiation regulator SeqA [Motilimonas eburnea]MCE2571642.1 replication initiation regulator SeqA [Motilimonas eburnea]
MKKIELDDELYQYIAAQTQNIGESASQILRRLLSLPPLPNNDRATAPSSKSNNQQAASETTQEQHDNLADSAQLDDKEPTPSSTHNVISEAKTYAEGGQTPSVDSSSLLTLLEGNELNNIEHSVERFLTLLSAMYHDSPAAFARASESTRGRKRLYFAQSEIALEEGGKTCKPRAIADTPFWVITNANNGRKRIIIAQLMASMGYAHHVIEKACATI